MAKLIKPEEIIMANNEFVKATKNSLIELNEACISFIFLYDNYNQRHLYDASILKEKMKNVVIRTVSDDL